MRYPWHSWLVLLRPDRVQQALQQVVQAGLCERAPSLWQVELGVLRMWQRVLFRSETIGTCQDFPVRATWRARLLQWRVLRGPFLLWERAIAPWDNSGLLSGRERLIRHLLGAHHDGSQFVYDLQLARLHPGLLDELRARAAAVVEGRDPRAEWLRDLVVYQGYHEALLRAVDTVLAGAEELRPEDGSDPDISLRAFLRWCAAQPRTPAETWRAWRRGRFTLFGGLLAEVS